LPDWAEDVHRGRSGRRRRSSSERCTVRRSLPRSPRRPPIKRSRIVTTPQIVWPSAQRLDCRDPRAAGRDDILDDHAASDRRSGGPSMRRLRPCSLTSLRTKNALHSHRPRGRAGGSVGAHSSCRRPRRAPIAAPGG